jgi:hypothetical protein
MIRNGGGFDNVDSNMDTVPFEEVIEMGKGVLPFLGRRSKEIIAGVGIDN